jgi:hydrogenase/urease accessory protein HupE
VNRPRCLLPRLILAAAWIACPLLVGAHEVRPAFLQIRELPDARYDVLWKQPTQGELAVRLVPHISGALLEGAPSSVESAPNFQIQTWHEIDAGVAGLEGRTVRIEGLEQTISDVLVSVTLLNGDQEQAILRPGNASLELHLGGRGLAVPAYLMLGVRHILTGADHLCFVLALLLLVPNRVMLLKTITAFTIAHSLTLAGTTLHLIAVQPEVIEPLVALSIVFVAVELANLRRGRAGLTARYPWLIAFTFGLLHGCAFAGALAEVGLPANAIGVCLLLFNLGVEIGQILFVAVALTVLWCLARLERPLPAWTASIAPYGIGTFALLWFLERVQGAIA